jgi:hypothetical protein
MTTKAAQVSPGPERSTPWSRPGRGPMAPVALAVGILVGVVVIAGLEVGVGPMAGRAPLAPSGSGAAPGPGLAPFAGPSTPGATTPSNSSVNWINITSTAGGPSPRNRVAMAYDAADGYVLLFGGYNAANGWVFYNDTWAFSNGTWTEFNFPSPGGNGTNSSPGAPGSSPSARANAGMVYDPALHAVVLFGGNAYGVQYNDTWEFAQGKWTPIATIGAPSPRFDMGMTYDAALGKVLLFGGDYAPSLNVDVALGDTWAFDGLNWTQLHPSSSPPARLASSMGYDSASSSVLLYGGADDANGTIFNDTWSYSNGTWTQLSLSVSPGARQVAASTSADSVGVLIFGGANRTGASLQDTWLFHAGAWSNVPTATVPGVRGLSGLAFDAARGYFVLFGGRGNYSSPFEWDTWILTGFNATTGSGGSGGNGGGEGGTGGGGSGGTGGGSGSTGGGSTSGAAPLSLNLGVVVGTAASLEATLTVSVFGGVPPFAVLISSGGGAVDSVPSYAGSAPIQWTTTYPAAGLYNAAVTVVDAPGARASAQTPVALHAPPGLSADVSEVVNGTVATATVTFVATIVGGAPPYSIQWAFGDGSFGSSLNGATFEHVYDRPGTFVPQLTITDGHGDQNRSTLSAIDVRAAGGGTSGKASSTTPPPALGSTLLWVAVVAVVAAVGAVAIGARERDRRRSARGLVTALESETDAVGGPPRE